MSGHQPGKAMSENHAHRRLADRVEPEQPGRVEAQPPNRIGAPDEEARRDEKHHQRDGEQIEAVQEAQGEEARSEEHTSELQSLMRISYDVFCLKKKNKIKLKHLAKTV